MSKRPTSTAASCPSCTTDFDIDVHMPYLGSCCHSVCALCVNGNAIEICPVCNNQQAFVLKKRKENILAMELLTKNDDLLTELDARKSNKPVLFKGEEKYEGEQIPAVLDPKNRIFLANVVNQLDPRSFLNLARTCKTLHNYCFYADGIEITYDIRVMSMKFDSVWKFCLSERDYDYYAMRDRRDYKPMNYEGYKFGILGNATFRKKLRNYPFSFRLKNLFIVSDVHSPAVFRSFFAEFPIDRFSAVTFLRISDWGDILQFLKDFHVEKVDFGWSTPPPEELHYEVFSHIFNNILSCSCRFRVPKRFILDATVPKLALKRQYASAVSMETSISRSTIVRLITKFAESTDDIDWELDCLPFDLRQGVFPSFKVLPFNYKKSLPNERPLILVRNDQATLFWLVRKDQQVMKCIHGSNSFQFTTCDPEKRPRCVKLYDQKHRE